MLNSRKIMDAGAVLKLRSLSVTIFFAGILLVSLNVGAAVQVITISEAPLSANYSQREIQIPQFDSSLGRLESVSIEVQATGSFTQEFEHLGQGVGNLIIQQRLRVSLSEADHARLLGLNQVENHRYSFSGFDGQLDFGGSSGGTHVYQVTASGERQLRSPDSLMQFTGCGFVDLFLNTTSDLREHLPRGGTLVDGLLAVGANIVVRYDYVAAVPEASTWLAGGVAVLSVLTAGFGRVRFPLTKQ